MKYIRREEKSEKQNINGEVAKIKDKSNETGNKGEIVETERRAEYGRKSGVFQDSRHNNKKLMSLL